MGVVKAEQVANLMHSHRLPVDHCPPHEQGVDIPVFGTVEVELAVGQGEGVQPDQSVRCFCDLFDFGSTQLAFSRSNSIGLVLSGSLCVIVDLGIRCTHC